MAQLRYFFAKINFGKQDNGFTLLEMMAVVIIVGILASLAIPRYQQYVARSQVSYAYMTLRAQQIAVDDLLMQGQTPSMVALGYNESAVKQDYGSWQLNNENTLQFNFDQGASSLLQTDQAAWLKLERHSLQWQCISSIRQKLLPQGCQTTTE